MDGGAITVRPGFGRDETCWNEVGRRKSFCHDADPEVDPPPVSLPTSSKLSQSRSRLGRRFTSDEVWILANNHTVARGEIEIYDDRISITVTRAADVYDFMAGAA